MDPLPGQGCRCSGSRTEQAQFCSDCGTRKQWIDRGPHSQVFECPDCS